MKEEILSGIKNAMERGDSLEQASKSFINAGYNSNEVNDAVSALSQGASTIVSPMNKIEEEKKFPVPKHMQETNPEGNISAGQERKKSKIGLVIVLVLILLLLAAGIVTMLIFREQVTDFIKSFI